MKISDFYILMACVSLTLKTFINYIPLMPPTVRLRIWQTQTFLFVTLLFSISFDASAQEKKMSKTKTDNLTYEANRQINLGNLDVAEQHLKQIINEGSGNLYTVQYIYGKLRLHTNEYTQARQHFEEHRRLSPYKPTEHYIEQLKATHDITGNPQEIYFIANQWFDYLTKTDAKVKDKTALNYWITEYLKQSYALGEKEAIQKIIEHTPSIKGMEKSSVPTFAKIHLALLEKDYDKAITVATDITNKGTGVGTKAAGRLYLAKVYIAMGDAEKAEEALNSAKKSVFVVDKMVEEESAEVAILKKEYDSALKYIKKALKGTWVMTIDRAPASNQFKLYYLQAEAYKGLGRFTEAQRSYEASLTYFPGYSLAEDGLANLIAKMEENRTVDKNPPTIEITAPALQRGLEIVSAKAEIMIKGIATDQSGIRAVHINDTPIYTKETGEFWGNYLPRTDLDSVKITAVDKAGNAAEKWLVINSSNSGSIAQTAKTSPTQGKNYCLLIASQNYEDSSIPSLEKPIGDAIKLKLILKRKYNFQDENIFTSFNPSQNDLKKVFTMLSEEIGENDNLVIFYAGHGIWSEQEKKGYWLLADALYNDKNTWFPNKSMLNLIGDISSRNTLLITDACFSGSVFRTRGINKENTVAEILSNKIARVAITSGNDSEVPDESVFMRYLIQALENNNEKSLSSQKMFVNHIIEAVMTESNTEPRYGTLEEAGHVGGDFIFTKN